MHVEVVTDEGGQRATRNASPAIKAASDASVGATFRVGFPLPGAAHGRRVTAHLPSALGRPTPNQGLLRTS